MKSEDLLKMGFPVAESGSCCPAGAARAVGIAGAPDLKADAGYLKYFPCRAKVKKMVADDAHTLEIRQVAIREGMTTLREDAWDKVRRGITTYEEALRVTCRVSADGASYEIR